jgi:hypothetical protein
MQYRYEPTPDEQLQAVEHIVHETRCLYRSYQLIQRRGRLVDRLGADEELFVFSAAFNDFVLHYRCLIHFFTDEPEARKTPEKAKECDDVVARHYVRSWKAPPMPFWAAWRDKVSKVLAHLTYTRCRINGLDHRTHFGPMSKEIQSAWKLFLGSHPVHEKAFEHELHEDGLRNWLLE